MEARLLLAAIVQRYHLVLAPKAKIEPRPQATLGFAAGVPMQVIRRF
jgi:hypothetical protein